MWLTANKRDKSLPHISKHSIEAHCAKGDRTAIVCKSFKSSLDRTHTYLITIFAKQSLINKLIAKQPNSTDVYIFYFPVYQQ